MSLSFLCRLCRWAVHIQVSVLDSFINTTNLFLLFNSLVISLSSMIWKRHCVQVYELCCLFSSWTWLGSILYLSYIFPLFSKFFLCFPNFSTKLCQLGCGLTYQLLRDLRCKQLVFRRFFYLPTTLCVLTRGLPAWELLLFINSCFGDIYILICNTIKHTGMSKCRRKPSRLLLEFNLSQKISRVYVRVENNDGQGTEVWVMYQQSHDCLLQNTYLFTVWSSDHLTWCSCFVP